MSASTNVAGVACCGNCGHELVVQCSGGCAEPDIELRENPIAAMHKPRPEARKKSVKYPPKTHCYCGEPAAVRPRGKGRPPSKCEKHLAAAKVYRDKWIAKRAAS